MGGTSRPDVHTLPNVLALTHRAHNLGRPSAHLDPTWARARGYLVSASVDHPGLVPVLLHGRTLVILGEDGDYLDPTGT